MEGGTERSGTGEEQEADGEVANKGCGEERNESGGADPRSPGPARDKRRGGDGPEIRVRGVHTKGSEIEVGSKERTEGVVV